MARRNRERRVQPVQKVNTGAAKEVKETTVVVRDNKELMTQAHKMCRDMRAQGLEFDYRTQLSLNLKYLHSIKKGADAVTKVVKAEEISINGTLVRVEKKTINVHMTDKEKHNSAGTRVGVVELDGEKYYFSANVNAQFPVVFGAKSLDLSFKLMSLLNRNMRVHGVDKDYFRHPYANTNQIVNDNSVYTDQISEGILIIRDNNKFFGYMGNRAVCFREGQDNHPCSCSIDSLIKDLDRPGKMSFRSMKGAGRRIEEELMPQFLAIIAKMKNNSPDPAPKKETPKRPSRSSRRARRGAVQQNNNREEVKVCETKIPFENRVGLLNQLELKKYAYELCNIYEKESDNVQKTMWAILEDGITPAEFRTELNQLCVAELAEMLIENDVIMEVYRQDPDLAERVYAAIK